MDTPESPKDALAIAFDISDHSAEIDKLLVIGVRLNGSVLSYDTGLTVDEAKRMCAAFISWMDQSIGRELERESRDPEA